MAGTELEGLSGSFVAAPLRGATAVLAESAFQPALLLAPVVPRDDRLVLYLAGCHVDGAIVILQHEISHLAEAIAAQVPTVFVGEPARAQTDRVNWVQVDDAAGGRMAAGALRVLLAGGRRVPSDVSIVGFDDTVAALTCDPPLTSMRQPFEEMGRVAHLLVDRT